MDWSLLFQRTLAVSAFMGLLFAINKVSIFQLKKAKKD